MNTKLCAFILGLCLFFPARAFAGDIFSFNSASPEEMVQVLKRNGISMPPEVAQALVTERLNGPFLEPKDLMRVSGMTQLLLSTIYPVAEEQDLVFDSDVFPSMRTY